MGEELPPVESEQPVVVVLNGCELNVLPGHPHLAPLAVDLELADVDHRLRGRHSATQSRPQPSQ